MSAFKPRTSDGNFLFSVILATAKMLFIVILILGITGAGMLVGIAKAWVETSPPLDISAFDQQAKTSFIYDKNGNLITDFKGTENRIEATIDELPKNLINAIIAIEDQRFQSHNGVDVKRIFGALFANIFNDKNQGGSTITQQLIKQTMLSTDQNFKRKLQEAYLALELEKKISKQDILTEYMNVIYLGGSNYGVKVAALDYFGKNLNQLNLKECATLAAIIRDPGRYNPRSCYYVKKDTAPLDDRTGRVLNLMLEQGLISDHEYQEALATPLNVLEKSQFVSKMFDNAYYVEYAIYDVVTKMLRVEGNQQDNQANRSAMENKLRTGGYHIYTALNPLVQEGIQEVITNWKNYPAMRKSADQTYKTKIGDGEYIQLIQPQAAAVVMDWHTGELNAIVGGRNLPTARKQTNRANLLGQTSGMPVGSSIKPLAVYGPAFDMGYSPGTPVVNAPLRIEGWNDGVGGKGYPNNFGGASFTGIESMRIAMNKSHNTAAAQVLMNYVGVENSAHYLQLLGIKREHIMTNGAGLALGSSGISPIEMTAAFGAIANNGEYLEPYAFTRVLNSDGSLYIDVKNVQIRRQAFKPSTAWLLVNVLKGCVNPKTGTGDKARFGNFEVAGKTGTNSDSRGVTFAGITGYLSACVWIGHDGYQPLVSNATGGNYAAPLWAAVMSKAHQLKGYTKNRKINAAKADEMGFVVATACAVSGMKPTAACADDVNGYKVTKDYYVKGSQPTQTCNMHRTIRLCTKSKKAPGKYCKSTKVYGTIYLPEGHPLRYAYASDPQKVRSYFKGASTDKDAAAVGVCKVCKSNSGRTATTSTASDKLQTAIAKAQSQVERAETLMEAGTLTSAQERQLTKARDYVQRAIEDESVANMNKYTKQLKQLVDKLSQ